MKNLLFLLLLTSTVAFAQKATLTGYIKDYKTGEPLIGATVKIDCTTYGGRTDFDGFYTINNIEPGSYNVTASFLSYNSQKRYNVVIRSAGTPDLNFDLSEAEEVLEEVVIEEEQFVRRSETPLSIQRLSREEIATYPGGNNDIAKVAQSLPGVSASVGGFRNDIIIRGGAPNENVYYLDGVEIPNINHFATQGSAGGPVGLLNVSFFEGVTVSTSSFEARYDNALSGVLQFDQRIGNNREFRNNIRISSSEAAFTTEGPLFKKKDSTQSKTSFIASVRRSYLQFLFRAIGLPFLPDYWDYQYKITHKIDKYNELNVLGVGSIDDFSINIPDELDEEQQATLEQVPVIKQWSTTHGISWKRRFKDGSGFMRTVASMNILNNSFSRFRDNENLTGRIFSNESQEWESKLRYDQTRYYGDNTLIFGAVLQNANYFNESENVVFDVNFRSSLNFLRYGVFAQYLKPYFGKRLNTSIGIRFDGNSFTDNGNNILSTFSPRASFSYNIISSGKFRFNGSLGRYNKITPYTVLGFQDSLGNYINRDSKYIISDHAVVGLEYMLTSSLKVSLESFYKNYSNYPISVRDGVSLANLGGGFEVLGNEEVISNGKGRAYGMEFLLQQKFNKNIYAILAYTLYKSEFTNIRDEFRRSAWDNTHLLVFTGGYKFKRNWEVNIRTRIVGRTPFAPVDLEATQQTYPIIVNDFDRFGEEELDVFEQTDIRIDKKWNFRKRTFNVFLEIQNITGSANPSPPNFGLARDAQGNVIQPETVRQIEAINSGSVLPSLGLVIDF